ncbi:serine hydrolase domain-containing protein [Roseivirga sp.]|uniref:serine hydrolase domain-containing protein n=1 Tax=Roseivirga sp. TaxID=1964215 RepID=UPI003B8D8A50
MKNRFNATVLFLFCSVCSFAQSEAQIDSIFSNWKSQTESPGGAAVIISKGEIIYNKGFGIANLGTGERNTPHTKFQLAGMSKHFTAFAIYLLADQGKLDIEDNISKYLSQFEKLDKKVTINHLLSNSSGFHDVWTLRSLAGWDDDDAFTHRDAMAMINAQEGLGFKPGSVFTNTDTEAILLAEIVSHISGLSFSEFCSENIFQPLGMLNTSIVDNVDESLSNKAISYFPSENGFIEVQTNYAHQGSANVYSSSTDLALWELNMLNPKIGSTEMFHKMNSAALLNNGNTINPTHGRLTNGQQFLHKERGVLNIYKTGSLGGYSSSMFKFPEDEFTIIVLSNSGEPYTGYLGMQTCYLFLENSFEVPATVDFASLKTVDLNRKALSEFAGDYWDKLGAVTRRIEVIDDTLRYVRSSGNHSALLPIKKNVFQMVSGGDESVIFEFNTVNGNKMIDLFIGESDAILLEAYIPTGLDENDLQKYLGTYLCRSLDIVFDISISNGQLLVKNIHNDGISLTGVTEHSFQSNSWFLGGVNFQQSSDGLISGFQVFTDFIRNLWFEKI